MTRQIPFCVKRLEIGTSHLTDAPDVRKYYLPRGVYGDDIALTDLFSVAVSALVSFGRYLSVFPLVLDIYIRDARFESPEKESEKVIDESHFVPNKVWKTGRAINISSPIAGKSRMGDETMSLDTYGHNAPDHPAPLKMGERMLSGLAKVT